MLSNSKNNIQSIYMMDPEVTGVRILGEGEQQFVTIDIGPVSLFVRTADDVRDFVGSILDALADELSRLELEALLIDGAEES